MSNSFLWWVAITTTTFLLLVAQESSAGTRWKNHMLPPGYELVDGEAIDITDKVIQMTTSSGTEYYPFDDTKGAPIYVRDGYEQGWHFIAFDDPYNQDPGGAHIIVLERMTGMSTDRKGQIIYETFLLSLEPSVGADVEPYDAKEAEYYHEEDREIVAEDMRKLAG